MLKRYWVFIAALGLAVAVSCPLAQDSGDGPRTDGTADDETAAPQRQTAPPAFVISLQNALDRIAAALEAQSKNEKLAEEEDRERRDLNAQESMAWWAMWVFWAGLVGVMISGFSLLLIRETVRFTAEAAEAGRASAGAAQDAVKQAREATEVAKRSDATTREMVEIQSRAYLGVGRVEFTIHPGATDDQPVRVGVVVGVVNGGSTPARQIDSSIKITWHVKSTYATGIAATKEGTELHDLMAGKETVIFSDTIVLTQSESDALMAGRLYFRVDGMVRYRPVVGATKRRVSFTYRVERDIPHKRLKVVRTTHGNQAN